MGCFSCKTPARPRPAASRRLGSTPSTGHVLLAGRKRDKASKHTDSVASPPHPRVTTTSSDCCSPLPLPLLPSLCHFSHVFLFVERILLSIWLCFHHRQWGSLSTMTWRAIGGQLSMGIFRFPTTAELTFHFAVLKPIEEPEKTPETPQSAGLTLHHHTNL